MFQKIVLVDNTGLHSWALDKLQEFSSNTISNYTTDPNTDEEIISRIGDAEAVFVSWRTPISKAVLKACSNIKYIGMCCSLYDPDSANVDVRFAQENNIVVKGIKDYGDEGVIEFIISEIIQLAKGLNGLMWKEEPVELGSQNIGIIGMGTTGKMLARTLRFFGANVYYYSRTPRPELEKENIHYLPLQELLQKVDVLSTHLPKHSEVLSSKEFEIFGTGKIIINTSLGLTFDKDAFIDWVSKSGNFAIFDGEGFKPYQAELSTYSNVILRNCTTGWTKEAKVRLSNRVIENVKVYFANKK